MKHGIIDVLAFQEALLIEAAFGIALLTMIWIGFRRWLQQKERIGRLSAEQTAEHDAQNDARMERVEARLEAIEQAVTDGGAQAPPQIDLPPARPLPNPILKSDEA